MNNFISNAGAINAPIDRGKNPERRDIVSKTRTIERVLTPWMWLFFLFVFATQTVIAQDEYFPTGSGDGTDEKPFQITSANELAALAALTNASESIEEEKLYRNACYILMNDIDLSVLEDLYFKEEDDGEGNLVKVGTGWIPIGNRNNVFGGVFDGNGKKVTKLYINQTGEFKGLFGRVGGSAAVIKNLGVVGDITNREWAGNDNWGEGVGGIVGRADGGAIIDNCWFEGSVTGHRTAIGGIVGYSNNIKINRCWSSATVKNLTNNNNGRLGGIVGALEGGGWVNNSYFTGEVLGVGERNGGIAGASNPGRISNCYVTGLVRGGSWSTGGILGFLQANTIIENCYIVSSVIEQGTPRLGGILGRANSNGNNVTIRNCIVLSPVISGDGGNQARLHGDPLSGGTFEYGENDPKDIGLRFTYSNNYAWEGTAKFDGSTDWGDCLIDNKQGKSVSVAEVRRADFFKNIFEAAVGEPFDAAKYGTGLGPTNEVLESTWTYTPGGLPSLNGETVLVPEHLHYTATIGAPAITTQPAINPAVRVGEPITLNVVATSPDGGGLYYQWYKNTSASNTGGVAIEGATDSSFDPDTDVVGTYYFYVVVTNGFLNGGVLVGTPLTSNVSTLTVTDLPTYLVTVSSIGIGATGGGTYLEGALVEINAGTEPKGYDFLNWTVEEGDVTLANPESVVTTFTMPDVPVRVLAVFGRITVSEDLDTTPLKAWVNNGVLHVSGFTAGKTWNLYNVTGALVKQGTAGSDLVTISLDLPGMYIIQSERKTLKVVFINQ